MPRYIDADALRDDIDNYDFTEYADYSNVIDMIDDAPTVDVEPVKGWISVKERLPKNDGEYIVWYRGKLEICEFNVESQTFGYTYDDYDEMYSHLVYWDDIEGVTHWMSLPEPPSAKMDGEGKKEEAVEIENNSFLAKRFLEVK